MKGCFLFMKITVALLQISGYDHDVLRNRAKGEEYCRRAQAMSADIALFPEMWSVAYTPAYAWPDTSDVWRSPEQWKEEERKVWQRPDWRQIWGNLAISRDDPFILHFRALAKELNMAIAITYLEKWDGPPRNTMSLIDRHGEIVMTYAKVHTCDFSPEEWALTAGDDFFVCTLDTEQGSLKVGAMICYDREFPESARILMLKGAELILTPNACDMESNRLAQFRTRANENMLGVAMTNYPGPRFGHSVAFHPMAFDDKGSRDTLIVEAGEEEGVYLAPFDMDAIRNYRRREAWGNAFRRPHRYGLLTTLAVEEPFIRVDVNGEQYNSSKR
jgi:N-carbamoylputrescine amidase